MRFLALALALLTFAGCSYKYPLTGGPSKDINTWLLGIWEHKDEKGNVYRASVQPLTGDRMTVWFRALGKTPKQTKQWKGEAWISRVGHANFLTIKCLESADDFPVDAFTFVHYQVLDQNHVATRPLQLDGMAEATSFQLRKEVRKKWKEKTLLPQDGALWTRIAEVYWDKSGQEEQPFIPPRYVPPPDPALQKSEKQESAQQSSAQQEADQRELDRQDSNRRRP